MREGEILELPVTRLGAQGDGLAELRGRPVYVPLALPGETIKVKLGRPIGEGYQGELIEVLKPSPSRSSPPCRHFTFCGGCSLQHLATPEYRAHKKAVVQGALRQHKLDENVVREPITIGARTRRRLTVAAQLGRDGRVIIGFNARASHQVIDIQECTIARPELVALLPTLRRVFAAWLSKAKALDLTLTMSATGIDLLVTGPEPDLAAREALGPLVNEPGLARVSWRGSERALSEPVMAKHLPVLSLAGYTLQLPPGAFLQASAEGEAALVTQVQSAIGKPEGLMADLFCGLGTFALPLSRLGPVSAYENDPALLAALSGTKAPDLKTEQRDLFRDPLTAKELDSFAAVVFDPPRAGAQAQVAELAKSKVPLLVAVSCNPGTFARDARALVDSGYKLEWVQPVDQFLWSGHVELVARFSR
jgi:23S rRNA (uracil1939-C5)-methyltransferase